MTVANVKINVNQLAYPTITRTRGMQAFVSIRDSVRDVTQAEVDLSGDQPLSLSFLDELIRLLAEEGYLSRVTFLVDQPEVLNKLAKISSIRQIDIYHGGIKGERREKVARLPVQQPKNIEVSEKPAPDEGTGARLRH